MCMSFMVLIYYKKTISMVQNSDNLCIYKRKYKDKLLAKYKE